MQPELDELIQQLREDDPEWLYNTLKARSSALTQARLRGVLEPHEKQNTETAVWPFDLTTLRLSIQPEVVSDYIRFLREYDWSATELGPMSGWDTNLRRKVNMCLYDKQAASLWIGPRFIAFYNEAYSVVIGNKHPRCLGQTFRILWDEPGLADQFEPLLVQSLERGIASVHDAVPIIAERHGYREEFWSTFSITPLPDSTGGVFGSYATTTDVTAKEVSRRRLTILLRLIQDAADARSLNELWQRLLESCEAAVSDVPFAMLYATQPDHDSDMADDGIWHLQGTVGLSGHSLPDTLDAQSAEQYISPAFAEAMAQEKPLFLDTQQCTLPESIQCVGRSRTHGDKCHSAVLFPITPRNSTGTPAFMMLGINPLAAFNEDYEQFLNAVMRECTTSLASLYLIGEQVNFATRLSKELRAKQEESMEMETRFQKMADLSPVAMFHLDGAGRVLYANAAWRELTQVPVTSGENKSWLDFVHEDDQVMADKEFTKLTQGQSVSFELRWKSRPLVYDIPERAGRVLWTIASAYPELNANDKVTGIYGCLTDITPQKWMQGSQERELKDALELKRQQENFMDMISHETRNPLSAIMLTVESIASELATLRPVSDTATVSGDSIVRMLENTEIIMTCVHHQKRIVDDVLTLSKFDSGLLDICQVPTRVKDVLAQTAKLFDAELKKHDVDMTIVVDDSYKTIVGDWLSLDPSRLQQVVINLITNAVKFTASQPQRSITIVLSASTTRPTTSSKGCAYVQDVEWRNHDLAEQPVFLSIEVIDTGRGMTATESAKLFHKFAQASPKTYAEYGGSGLGLFICKQLCQLQGGAIGVASRLGAGTTFAFYITASRCSPPEETTKLAAIDESSQSNHAALTSPVAKHRRDLTAHPYHILLVEDNLINQRVLRTMLERAHYTVQVANHGLEALDYIMKTHWSKPDGVQLDVVLLDIEMPVCDGLECARRVRQHQDSGVLIGHIPIIGVTANARGEQQQLAIEAGMDTVVTKPFKMKQLIDKLDELDVRSKDSGLT
ncbi:hypothetical protein AMS68_002749 [Peltaster fructicola]|uniref:histidine kinase n=1 Tax=Peltaster fructicola TaxID=286661 RepID=A0A6H0XR31_9PEZI|nr:hypothetical protein AMS68_002749 [Peltaster fructicola]